MTKTLIISIFLISFGIGENIFCDADLDCFYIPAGLRGSGEYFPALIILSCTGATSKDLDSVCYIADSLRMVFATCHKSKNRRDIFLNDKDIMNTYEKLVRDYPVDGSQVFIYGFSGQGVQVLMELFNNPKSFRGVIAACAHKGTMSMAKWQELGDKSIYLISREKDWNLADNRQIHSQFQLNNIQDTLVITPGEHVPANPKELFNACFWLLSKIEP